MTVSLSFPTLATLDFPSFPQLIFRLRAFALAISKNTLLCCFLREVLSLIRTCPTCVGLVGVFQTGNKGRTQLELSNPRMYSQSPDLFLYPVLSSCPDSSEPSLVFPLYLTGLQVTPAHFLTWTQSYVLLFGFCHLNFVLYLVRWHLALLSWEFTEILKGNEVSKIYGMGVEYSYNGKLLSNKNEWNTDICDSMVESPKYVEWKEKDKRLQTLWFHL